MSSRRKSRRSLSLRTSSFIRLISPFRSRSVNIFQIPQEEDENKVRLHSAKSDSQLHVSYKMEQYKRQGRILDSSGRIITNSPNLSSPHVGYVKNNLNLDPQDPLERNMFMSNPNLSKNVLDTSWLSQDKINRNITETNWVGEKDRIRLGLLGRSAVSYQNISPSGDIFAEKNKECVESNPSSSFSAEGSRSTTNVAWLVGAANPPVLEHHIDILDKQEINPPSHLEVAPIGSTLKVKDMGYSLTRSKTVSDMPLWARDISSEDESKPRAWTDSIRIISDESETMSDSGSGLTAATLVTMGSLRSKIVKHRTLLGSSTRLYKFSQSLSSLTTVGSESRTSSWERTMSQRKR